MAITVVVPPKRANEPYSESEVELILSSLPTYQNARVLGESLQRSAAAIMTVFKLAYSGKWLKQTLEAKADAVDPQNVHTRIGRVKKKLGIVVGHLPS